MAFRILFLFFLYYLPTVICQESSNVTIIVRGSTATYESSDSFICATIDWWPPTKCNYDQCPWGQSSVLNLDLKHPFLAKAIGAFNPLRIRVGGSLQDQVEYDTENLGHSCLPFSKESSGLFGFSKGCLSMARWDELNLLFQKTRAIVTFGINALSGRHQFQNGTWGGPWNSSNAYDFIKYTLSKGYRVDSWEFGNELSGSGIGARVDVEQYGKDVIALKSILDDLYNNSSVKPLLLAPGGFFDQQWYARLLQDSGLGVINGMTHHIYNLGGGNDPRIVNKIMDPQYLNQIANTFRNLKLTIERYGPWSSSWVGEAGGAFNSGSRLVSNTFLNSFWYLDQLGMASQYNTKAYCRQTLIGGNYGLLDTTTFIPNPDYYSALLWHRLMGKRVLSIDLSGSPYLRAYAHCRKHKGGVTLLLINLSNSTEFTVAVRNDVNVNLVEGGGIHKDGSFVHDLKRTVAWMGRKALERSEKRKEYHLTAKDGNYLGHTMLLNGTPLELSKHGDIPHFKPMHVPANSPLSIAPLSIAFVVFPNFEVQACV